MKLQDHIYLSRLADVLSVYAPYLHGVIAKQHARFGDSWLNAFDADLQIMFKDRPDALHDATRGYIKFALDGMLLQKRFDKTGIYQPKSFEQATEEVYGNREYMHGMYLPGIYLSHFLWRHHYLQYLRFHERVVPLMRAHGGKRFYDVGVGTGFYSRELLKAIPDIQGTGYDLSDHSLSYTEAMIAAFDCADRYNARRQNILVQPRPEPVPFLMSVEVLEHLEEPLVFLQGLFQLLEPGGIGMITAAVTAPNADHIYLYRNLDEVVSQVKEAGFTVIEAADDVAYDAVNPHESVPRNASVIVTR